MNTKTAVFDLALFLSKLPNEPGIYRMLDEEGRVLYVGKASNLKKRVSSYFNKQNTGLKTRALLEKVKSLDISITRSETEALLLESNLIKTLRPKYNVLLRDDKSYPYIHITNHPDFPRLELYRSKKKPPPGHFFGPYPSTGAVKETLVTLQKVFKLRNCPESYFNARTRPCLQYQIKRCTAPCVGYIEKAQYQQSVRDAIAFLQGKSQIILDEIAKRMNEAVSLLQFEEAAILRERMKSLGLIQERQSMMLASGDVDAIAILVRPGFACVQCVSIREGQVIANQHFFPQVPKLEEDLEEDSLWQQTFEAFVSFYYFDTPNRIPGLILTNQSLTDQQALEEILSEKRGKSCSISVNPRGKKSGWMDFAINNLQLSVNAYNTRHSTIRLAYQELESILNLDKPIQTMECFDISHTQGDSTIASCVVFDENGPNTKEYRRFNIEGITPGDDYAAMEQALTRRYKRLLEAKALPTLLIIDGGKGQVGIAKKVLAALDCSQVFLLGIAKGPSRKPGWEKLILSNENKTFSLASDSKALHLLQQIRDEAHRFAITAHRKKRGQKSLKSSLEDIEGVGAKRRQALLQRFGGIRELAKASVLEIAKVQGISQELAQRIYNHFH